MRISQEQFVLFLAGLGFAFAWLFWYRFSSERLTPSQLKMRDNKKSDPPTIIKAAPSSKEVLSASGSHQATRDLHVRFMYNGHVFEAYEVFGLPAGAPLERVQQAYQKLIAQELPASENLQFIDLAYRALLKHLA